MMVYNIENYNGDKFANESIYKIIEETAPPINVSFIWQNTRIEKEIFAPIFARGGFCFTLNAINSHEAYTEA